MKVDFRKSEAAPVSIDVGNQEIQDRIVSKTIQMAMFTQNKNAVWAGRQSLLKESYPFALISFSANRNVFRYEVGDCFKFSYAQYGISNMVCRVLQIEEAELESEIITIHAMEDIFSVNNLITEYFTPQEYTVNPPDYSIEVLDNQDVVESPFIVNGGEITIIPTVARSQDNQLGYYVYMSSDDGESYTLIDTYERFTCYGTLVREYPAETFQIDDAYGIIADFDNDDISQFETTTRQVLLGITNLISMGNEIMTVQNIDPVDGGEGRRYYLTGVYRGRFDTEREDHEAGDGFYLAHGASVHYVSDEDVLLGTSRKFKFVPYNEKETASIADCPVIELTIDGRARKPYTPINFKANGDSIDPGYSTDIDLTWSPRIRDGGAGYFAPSITDSSPTWEGFFKIEVWEKGNLKRTVEKLDAITWTYTEAMNLADNVLLGESLTFKLTNFIEYDEWPDAESNTIEITVGLTYKLSKLNVSQVMMQIEYTETSKLKVSQAVAQVEYVETSP